MKINTKSYKLEHFGRIQAELYRNECAVSDLVGGRVTWSGWSKEIGGGGKYRAGVSRFYDAGGLLLISYRHQGQSDSVNVYDLETHYAALLEQRRHAACVQPILDAVQDAVNLAKLRTQNTGEAA